MEDEPFNMSGVMSAEFVHGTVRTTLEADVVVETILLEFNVDVLEPNDEALAGRRSVRGFDVQSEVQVVGIRCRIVGRFHAAFLRLD